jgi:hypothetical protein
MILEMRFKEWNPFLKNFANLVPKLWYNRSAKLSGGETS